MVDVPERRDVGAPDFFQQPGEAAGISVGAVRLDEEGDPSPLGVRREPFQDPLDRSVVDLAGGRGLSVGQQADEGSLHLRRQVDILSDLGGGRPLPIPRRKHAVGRETRNGEIQLLQGLEGPVDLSRQERSRARSRYLGPEAADFDAGIPEVARHRIDLRPIPFGASESREGKFQRHSREPPLGLEVIRVYPARQDGYAMLPSWPAAQPRARERPLGASSTLMCRPSPRFSVMTPMALMAMTETELPRVSKVDSSVSETYGRQEGTAYNGHFGCMCYHPLFCFNKFGDVEFAPLREGNVHSAKDWRTVLEPIVARYRDRDIPHFFRGDAAFANSKIYEYLEGEHFQYVIRLPANDVLHREIEHLMTRPVGRPPKAPIVLYHEFYYQAAVWDHERRVIAKVEWHRGEALPPRRYDRLLWTE